jgi:apolipoprotein N-acyltransferase
MPLRAIAYTPVWRAVAAVLVAVGNASMPLLLALVLFARNPPIVPLMLLRAFTILVVAPRIALWLIARALTATVTVADGTLVLTQRDRRIAVPPGALATVEPWIVPLPGSGVTFRLRSGTRVRQRLQLADPTVLGARLAAGGALPAEVAAAVNGAPPVRYAHAKHARPPSRWYACLLKFPLFALVPTLPLFRVHQYIAYGGAFGQYYLQGLGPYLQRFALYWGTVTLYLILYAAVWRGIAEGVALATAWVAPSRAARVRQAVEIGARVAYYAGVPILLILWFVPW